MSRRTFVLRSVVAALAPPLTFGATVLNQTRVGGRVWAKIKTFARISRIAMADRSPISAPILQRDARR